MIWRNTPITDPPIDSFKTRLKEKLRLYRWKVKTLFTKKQQFPIVIRFNFRFLKSKKEKVLNEKIKDLRKINYRLRKENKRLITIIQLREMELSIMEEKLL